MPMREMLIVALAAAAVLTASPALARRERPGPDAACDAFLIASRAAVPPIGLLIAGFDANGDALVDRAELKAGAERMFKLADRDHDGSLSLIELSQWAAQWLGGPSAVPGRFDFDRDQDDRISKQEFLDEIERRFRGFDKDQDGAVTRAELLAQTMPANCKDGRLIPPSQGEAR